MKRQCKQLEECKYEGCGGLETTVLLQRPAAEMRRYDA
jgi:hypothetical protein